MSLKEGSWRSYRNGETSHLLRVPGGKVYRILFWSRNCKIYPFRLPFSAPCEIVSTFCFPARLFLLFAVSFAISLFPCIYFNDLSYDDSSKNIG